MNKLLYSLIKVIIYHLAPMVKKDGTLTVLEMTGV